MTGNQFPMIESLSIFAQVEALQFLHSFLYIHYLQMPSTIILIISVLYNYIWYYIFAFTFTFILIYLFVSIFLSIFCPCRYLGIRMVDLTPARPTATFEPTVEVQYADGDVSWFKRIVEKELWLYRCVGENMNIHSFNIFFHIFYSYFFFIFQ